MYNKGWTLKLNKINLVKQSPKYRDGLYVKQTLQEKTSVNVCKTILFVCLENFN